MEFTNANELIVVDEDIDVYVDMDEDSEVLVSYPKGSMVFVSGKSKEWIRVLYRGQEGYMKSNSAFVDVNLNVEELDEEFAADARNEEIVVETAQAQEAYKKSNFFWISLIVVLILAIVGVTLYEKKKRGAEEQLDDKATEPDSKVDELEIIDLSNESENLDTSECLVDSECLDGTENSDDPDSNTLDVDKAEKIADEVGDAVPEDSTILNSDEDEEKVSEDTIS
ncbi:MAG: hypothetical protein MJZ11_10000 [Lachnospiraceae bacterium]|nr:hypothetical protein [Lachnospiraceae bacterium]